MVELGNMRDRKDARIITSAKGRARCAGALVAGMRAFLGRRPACAPEGHAWPG